LALTLGAGLWGYVHHGAQALLESKLPLLGSPEPVQAFAAEHMRRVDRSYLIGVIALGLLCLVRRPLVRWTLLAVPMLVIFYQNAWMHRNYNPTIDEQLFFPRTEAITSLAEETAGELVAILGVPPLPAETNACYRISMLANYDALSDPEHDWALRWMCGSTGIAKDPACMNPRAMAMFGARFLLHPRDWPLFDSEHAKELVHKGGHGRIRKLAPDEVLTQEWRASRSGLQAAMVTLHLPNDMSGQVSVVLEEVDTGLELSREVYTADRAANSRCGGDVDLILTCAPRPDSAGKLYRLRIRGEGLSPESLPRWIHMQHVSAAEGRLMLNGEVLPGMLRGDLSYAHSSLSLVKHIGPLRLQEYLPSLGRYFVVEGWQHCPGKAGLRQSMSSHAWDPYRTVLFETGIGPAGEAPQDVGPGQAVVPTEELPGRIELEVEREKPGLLVIARSHLPGWRAYVNGVEAPLWPANLAFSALALEAGRSKVELVYQPRSVQLGAICSLASLGGLLALAWWSRRREGALALPLGVSV
jgi:hypothetical protein